MLAYRYNRSVSARNPQMPDSGNQRIAAGVAWKSFRRHARAVCEALPEDVCHRCGGAALVLRTVNNEDALVCTACGWICGQDGMPIP
jgi:hypothetical protein